MAGLVVTTVVSAVLFGLAHGSPDPWVLLSIATLAVAACLANWRTGGLEAGIAMHAVNNVGVGRRDDHVRRLRGVLRRHDDDGRLRDFFPGLVVHALAVGLILWQARRVRIDRTSRPVARVEVEVAPWSYGRPVPTRPARRDLVRPARPVTVGAA